MNSMYELDITSTLESSKESHFLYRSISQRNVEAMASEIIKVNLDNIDSAVIRMDGVLIRVFNFALRKFETVALKFN